MSHTTDKLELPVPDGGDPADIAAHFQAMADRIEALLYGGSDLAGTPIGTTIFNVRNTHFGRWLRLDGTDRTQAEIESALGLDAGDAADFVALMGTGSSSKYGSAATGKVRIPDARRRLPTMAGPSADGPGGLSARALGDSGGAETVTLTSVQSGLPVHSHAASQAAHSHSITDPGHGHGATSAAAGAHSHGGTTGNESAHTHDGGTLGTDSQGAHTHGVGTLVTANESSHTHGVGTYSVGSHTHTNGTLSASSAGAHDHGGTVGTKDLTHTHGFGGTRVADTAATGAGQRLVSLADSRDKTQGGVTANEVGFTTQDRTYPGAVDGAMDHTHTIQSAGAHTHTVVGATGSTLPAFTGNSGTGSAHNHTITGATASAGSHAHSITTGSSGAGTAHSHTISAAADHTHTITVTATTTGITLANSTPAITVSNSTGADATNSHENMPPHVVLGFGFIRV